MTFLNLDPSALSGKVQGLSRDRPASGAPKEGRCGKRQDAPQGGAKSRKINGASLPWTGAGGAVLCN